MIVAVVLLWIVGLGIVAYPFWGFRAGVLDGEDTIRRLAREAREARRKR